MCCCCCLLLDNVGAMHLLSTPQAVAHGCGAGAASSLCPGEGGGGCIVSMMWQVYKGWGAYLVGLPALSSLPLSSSFPISSPPSCQLLSWQPHLSITLPGHRVHIFSVVGLVFSLRNKLNVSVSKIEHEEKKKKLTLAQTMIHVVCV